MQPDLEAILCQAFAPISPETRHVELRIACARCQVLVETMYPLLGLSSEVRCMKNCRLGQHCSGCRRKFEMTSHLTSEVLAVEPEERGWAYCMRCAQIRPLNDMTKTPIGLQCSTCVALEDTRARAQTAPDGDGGWEAPCRTG